MMERDALATDVEVAKQMGNFANQVSVTMTIFWSQTESETETKTRCVNDWEFGTQIAPAKEATNPLEKILEANFEDHLSKLSLVKELAVAKPRLALVFSVAMKFAIGSGF